MEFNTRRGFFGKIAAMTTFVAGVPKLFAQQTTAAPAPGGASQGGPGGDAPRRPAGSHTYNGIYYFSGTGSTGKARFDAHKTQYDALNKIYQTYFMPGKAPSRACMAVEWIPGDSLIEIVGSALVVNPPTPPAEK